ncbi:radical SAM/SPASM domain-containing protein [Magnetospirillum sulfuroxidans]|uniref:Radical SAM protein n=1 Tax=Magnetospirillum sulfuroxidans TaxID=611300 RepID=A0ABS5IAC5_9PROT|nr:radical SAM/SPASM domain-containing protein [Magnetospirillum sulfuroxidans]MBR9971368.1 radical SAM protein [Magnetospirillum sulfuroxidans]
MSPSSPADLLAQWWGMHPHADMLLPLAGGKITPPAHVGVVLTNKCNLRCDICGSQQTLDRSKTARTSMPLEIFHAVAETLFPTAVTVELNSQGDPLFYPHIEDVLSTVAKHECNLRVQTNGTVFTPEILDLLMGAIGTVSISIDAVGDLFDQVRRNGVWSKADPMIRQLAARRRVERLRLQLYPTITARTVGGMLDVAQWADEIGIDVVDYHLYNPIWLGTEAVPDLDELARQRDAIQQWASRQDSAVKILVQGDVVHAGRLGRQGMASAAKGRFFPGQPCYPLAGTSPYAHPTSLCRAPFDYVEIGMNGEVAVCCRTQTEPLGFATSAEAFAAVWFGQNYQRIRQSLERGVSSALPLPPCKPCIEGQIPGEPERQVVDYTAGKGDGAMALVCREPVVPLLMVQRLFADGHSFVARIPLGLDLTEYELFEDEGRLGPAAAPQEEVRTLGAGRYGYKGNSLFFSSSDGSDPMRNDRRYELRRQAAAP